LRPTKGIRETTSREAPSTDRIRWGVHKNALRTEWVNMEKKRGKGKKRRGSGVKMNLCSKKGFESDDRNVREAQRNKKQSHRVRKVDRGERGGQE